MAGTTVQLSPFASAFEALRNRNVAPQSAVPPFLGWRPQTEGVTMALPPEIPQASLRAAIEQAHPAAAMGGRTPIPEIVVSGRPAPGLPAQDMSTPGLARAFQGTGAFGTGGGPDAAVRTLGAGAAAALAQENAAAQAVASREGSAATRNMGKLADSLKARMPPNPLDTHIMSTDLTPFERHMADNHNTAVADRARTQALHELGKQVTTGGVFGYFTDRPSALKKDAPRAEAMRFLQSDTALAALRDPKALATLRKDPVAFARQYAKAEQAGTPAAAKATAEKVKADAAKAAKAKASAPLSLNEALVAAIASHPMSQQQFQSIVSAQPKPTSVSEQAGATLMQAYQMRAAEIANMPESETRSKLWDQLNANMEQLYTKKPDPLQAMIDMQAGG